MKPAPVTSVTVANKRSRNPKQDNSTCMPLIPATVRAAAQPLSEVISKRRAAVTESPTGALYVHERLGYKVSMVSAVKQACPSQAKMAANGAASLQARS